MSVETTPPLPVAVKCPNLNCVQMMNLHQVQYSHTHGWPLRSVRAVSHYYECPICIDPEYGGRSRMQTDASFDFNRTALNDAWLNKYGEPYPFDPA